MSKGLFIVFEGIDGSGTTTQCKILSDKIARLGHPVVQTREPGGTPMGELIRGLILDPKSQGIFDLTELLLYAASRAQHVIELRQAPFLFWIQDLSVPDEILIAGFGLHVLPLLMAVAMFFQQKMTMTDPKQAALVYLMPVMMVFIFWSLSSGLVLYWTVFNVLSIAQQALTARQGKVA